ncbi:MAG: hypothetical protein U0640_13460 [Phycisphaerales bacterium]
MPDDAKPKRSEVSAGSSRQISSRRFAALIPIKFGLLDKPRFLTSRKDQAAQFLGDAAGNFIPSKVGCVAISLLTKDRWYELSSAQQSAARALIAESLRFVLLTEGGPDIRTVEGATFWLDVSVHSDYPSARLVALHITPTQRQELDRFASESRGSGPGVQEEQRDLSKPDRRSTADAGEYSTLRSRLDAMFDHTRQDLARQLAPALQKEALSRPHETYDQKKSLAKWINGELRRYGLAIRCPRTGQPSLLLANAGGVAGIGRFHIEHTDSAGKRHRSVTSVTLPPLDLMTDDLSRAPYGERSERSR